MTTRIPRAAVALTVGILSASLLSGCSGTGGSEEAADGGVGGTSEAAAPSASSASASQAGTGADDLAFTAISTAESTGGKAMGIDRLDDGAGGYKVEILDGSALFAVTVDEAAQKAEQRQKVPADAKEVKELKGIEVPLTEALKTAQQEAPEMRIDEAEADDEDGAMQWKVELDVDNGQGSKDVVVDAKSGSVLK